MNKLDDLAWKREFDRVEANQKKAQKFHEELLAIDPFYRERMMKIKKINEVKDNENEINR